MTALLALFGKLIAQVIGGLAAALPFALAFVAGRRGAQARQLKRSERRRHGQLQIRRPGDRAVLDSLRRGGF
jgi:hypothetical protein